MYDLLVAIEQFAPVRLLRASFFVYPLVSATHVLSVGALVTCVALLDLRMLGLLRAQSAAPFVALMRRVALGAFGCAAATGIALLSVRAAEYGLMPLFLAKLGLIGMAILNFLAFSRMAGLDPDRPTGSVVKLSAALSIGLWLTVLVCGRFLGFV